MDKEDKIQESLADLFSSENMDWLQNNLESVLQKVFKEKQVPQDALGISDATAEKIYGQAYQLFNSGRYVEASRLFRTLILLNITEPKYALGLAGCFHMLKEYKNAAEAYMRCGLMDPESPIPFYHASDCYVNLGETVPAIVSLQLAVQRAGDKPAYSVIKERALLTIERLKNEQNSETKDT